MEHRNLVSSYFLDIVDKLMNDESWILIDKQVHVTSFPSAFEKEMSMLVYKRMILDNYVE